MTAVIERKVLARVTTSHRDTTDGIPVWCCTLQADGMLFAVHSMANIDHLTSSICTGTDMPVIVRSWEVVVQPTEKFVTHAVRKVRVCQIMKLQDPNGDWHAVTPDKPWMRYSAASD